MKKFKMNFEESLKFVKIRRRIIKNSGFKF